jgi:hypothetical protein
MNPMVTGRSADGPGNEADVARDPAAVAADLAALKNVMES